MKYYVYKLIDPRTDKVFYVGKGSGDRYKTHTRKVKSLNDPTKFYNERLYYKIQDILNDGYESIPYELVYEEVEEQKALKKEEDIITEIGLHNLCNKVKSQTGKNTSMLNVRLEDKHRNHLDRVSDNRSEYVRNLIEEDIKRTEPEDPAMEFRRCQENILYFVREYGYYKDPRKGLTRVRNLNDFQQSVLTDLAEGENVIIKKGRQKRVTTTLQHFVLWNSLFNSGTTTCLSTYKRSVASRMKDTVLEEEGYNLLPDAFKCGFMENSTEKSVLKNASTITTGTDGYYAPDTLIIEEAGYMDELSLDGHVDMRPHQTVVTYTVQDLKPTGDEKTETKEVDPNNKEQLENLFTHPDYSPYTQTNLSFTSAEDSLTIDNASISWDR